MLTLFMARHPSDKPNFIQFPFTTAFRSPSLVPEAISGGVSWEDAVRPLRDVSLVALALVIFYAAGLQSRLRSPFQVVISVFAVLNVPWPPMSALALQEPPITMLKRSPASSERLVWALKFTLYFTLRPLLAWLKKAAKSLCLQNSPCARRCGKAMVASKGGVSGG